MPYNYYNDFDVDDVDDFVYDDDDSLALVPKTDTGCTGVAKPYLVFVGCWMLATFEPLIHKLLCNPFIKNPFVIL